MKTRLFAGLAFACLTIGSASASPAAFDQPATQPSQPLANRAVVVKVERLPDATARAVVIRRPAATGTQDIILVDASTRPADLAKAVAALIFSRRNQGQGVDRELRANIAAAVARKGRKSADEIRAARDLAKLEHAPFLTISGVASGRVIPIATSTVVTRK